jgi:S1-C subfamily serine protease
MCAGDKTMENERRNDTHQNIRVVLPPRPERKAKGKPEPEAVQGENQPVRVTIPPHPSRRTASPQQTMTPPASSIMPPVASVTAPRGARAERSFEQLAQLAPSVVMITVHDYSGEAFAGGSGIMIGSKGYILTNNHVLEDGSFFSVRIENDEQTYRTKEIIKYNQVLDLAVIRIDRALDPLPIYHGPQLSRGQKVVAIGSPLGYFNSVSDGIISGIRVLDDVQMIQYTAPGAPGSSGGALLNMYGEVIGIVSASSRGSQGINWAVGYEFINMFVQGFVK